MKIEFDLLGNAGDSLERALELIAWGDQQHEARRLKQAVQSVAHAIELLLKERLRRLHPSLIWENVDKYPNLSARTVGADLAALRLKTIGGLSFATPDIELLRSLRATRNAIEHFAWVTTKPEADAIVGRALEFAFHFARTELSIEYLDYGAYKDGTYHDLISANPEFGQAVARRKLHIEAPQDGDTLFCPFCRAKAVDAITKACRICGHWEPERQGFEDMDDDIPF